MTLDPAELKFRLTRKLSLLELMSLTTAIIFGIGMIVLNNTHPISGLLFDFMSHTNAAKGDMRGYFYGLWGIPFLYPYAVLPFNIGALVWQLTNIFGMFFSARLFGGKSAALLFSYQMFVDLYFGQISGVICFGIMLMWLGLSKRNWVMAGLGLTIAAIKPQVGIIAGLIWLYALLSETDNPSAHRRTCFMALLVPAAAIALSFVLQPDWVTQTFVRLETIPPNDDASITAWDYIGAWGLLVLIPPLLLPLDKRTRLLALISAWMISAPYFQPYDMASLFMLLPNWFPVLSWIAVPFGYPYPALPLVFLLLLIAFYLWEILPGIFSVLGMHPLWFDRLQKSVFPKPQQLKCNQKDEQRIVD